MPSSSASEDIEGIYPNVYPPHIYSTTDWDARINSTNLNILSHPASKIIIHNTEWPNSPNLTQSYAFQVARQIQDLHMDENGWADTGQHFTISRGGWICEGRHFSLRSLQNGHQFVQSAHCSGLNSEAIGIECDGKYNDTLPTKFLFDSLVNLAVNISTQYNLSPNDVFSHREFVNTDCPGNQFYSVLGHVRSALSKRLNKPITMTWPQLRMTNTGENVKALQFLLNSHGFTLNVDGVFGNVLAAVLTAFQQIHNIARADTHVRESAWRALIAGRTLCEGSEGDAVRAVQTLLKRNGMDVQVTGNFDLKTTAAVKTMQRWRGLSQDGVVGAQTWCAVVGGITPAEMELEPLFEFGPVEGTE